MEAPSSPVPFAPSQPHYIRFAASGDVVGDQEATDGEPHPCIADPTAAAVADAVAAGRAGCGGDLKEATAAAGRRGGRLWQGRRWVLLSLVGALTVPAIGTLLMAMRAPRGAAGTDGAGLGRWTEDGVSHYYSLWEVVAQEPLTVRMRGNASSPVLRSEPPGAIVAGEQVGRWVRAIGKGGYLPMEAPSGAVLLTRTRVTFAMIGHGACADASFYPITDEGTCEAAAATLGLPDPFVETSRGGEPRRPEGCHAALAGPRGHQLWLAGRPSQRRRGASDGLAPLCASRAPLGNLRAASAPPPVRVVTVETRRGTNFTMAGVKGANEIRFTNLGVNHSWHGFMTKVRFFLPWMQDQVRREPEEVLVLADGNDMTNGGCTQEEIRDRYARIIAASGGANVVIGGDTQIWPTSLDRKGRYNLPFFHERRRDILKAFGMNFHSYKPWMKWGDYRFVNSGFIMGPAKDLQRVLECMHVVSWGRGYDDQLALAECMFRLHPLIVIDYSGALVLTIKGIKYSVVRGDGKGRAIFSFAHHRKQCFLHMNWPQHAPKQRESIVQRLMH